MSDKLDIFKNLLGVIDSMMNDVRISDDVKDEYILVLDKIMQK